MLMTQPEILIGKIGFSDDVDEYGSRKLILEIDNPTPEEQAAFDEYVKNFEMEKAAMLVEID